MMTQPKDDPIQTLIAECLQAGRSRPQEPSRRRGRPAIPHREWLRAEVSRDLLELLRKEASDLGITVTTLMSVVLCDRYGVWLTADNRIALDETSSR